MFKDPRSRPIAAGLVFLLATLSALQLTTKTSAFAAPANDNFINAEFISGRSGSITRNNVQATKQAGEPNHAGKPGGASVWFAWTAPDNAGEATFRAFPSSGSFDSLLAVYTGNSVNALTEIASNDNAFSSVTYSQVTFKATTGVTYYIAVDGVSGAQGTFSLTYLLGPANDKFADAQVINSPNVTEMTFPVPNRARGNLGAAHSEVNEPTFGGGFTVWFKWTAPDNRTATFSAFNGAGSVLVLAVYTGNAVSALTLIGSNQNQVSFSPVTGTRYYIQLDIYSGSDFDFVFSMVPYNDNLANAEVISGASGKIFFNNTGSTKETGETFPIEPGATHSVWYRWQATQTLPASQVYFQVFSGISDTQNSLDPVLTAYSGPATGANVGNITFLGGATGDLISFSTVAGNTYYIRIHALSDREGTAPMGWSTGSAFISGKVVDGHYRGVPGAIVTLSGSASSTITTSADGIYNFTNLSYTGSYAVSAKFRGNDQPCEYCPGGFVYQFSQPSHLQRYTGDYNFFVTSPLVNLKGKIVDANNTSLGVAGVTVNLTGDATGTVTTDSTGIYTFPSLVILGDYFLDLSRPGFTISPPNYPCVRCEGNELLSHTAQDGVILTVASSNPASGVSITLSPNDKNAQGNGTTQFTRNYNNNTVVSLTAPATASGNTFQKWQRDGADFAVTAATSVTMDANHTMTAVYLTPTRTLTVASSNPASGVAITVSPNDNNAAGNGTTQFTRVYNNTTLVSLTAPATASGNNFQKWLKDGADFANNTVTNVSVTMDAAHTMTAVYLTPTRTLTVASSNPASGVAITVSPNDNNAGGSGTTQFTRVYNNLTAVSLTAPATASGNNFQKWLKDGADFANNTVTNVSVTMDADHTMTAVYLTPTRTLTVASSNPASGVSITVSPNDNNAAGNGATQFTRLYNNNQVVSLTAAAAAGGNNFQKWLKDSADFAGNTSANVSVTMDANHTMTAVYVSQTRTLTVASTNPASGVAISMSPNDNNAAGNGTTQFTRVYNNNQNVVLTAPATASGNTFQKWQRDGVDLATTIQTTVTMDADHVLTAVFVTPQTIQFDSANYSAAENVGSKVITVIRIGGTSGPATVNYATGDTAGANKCDVKSGIASSRCDYETTLGTLNFAAGETSRMISIPIIDDSYAEGDELFTVTLSNPVGATLVAPSSATVAIVDNDSANSANPIMQARYFVRMHYLDFLNREPDTSGWDFWTNQITNCGNDVGCTEVKRIDGSASFFLSIEFQQTGYLVERMYKVAYGDVDGTSTFPTAHSLKVPVVRFNEFLADTQQITRGVVVLQPGWEQLLESNKVAFFNEFVQRARFTTGFPQSMSATDFVDKLNTNAGNPLSAAERTQLASDLSSNTKTRAQVVRFVAEHPNLVSAEFNRAFVLMQYFGYLRRNPNDPQDTDYSGYDFWLTKLNQFNGNYNAAEMVKAFISSIEYGQRFGP